MNCAVGKNIRRIIINLKIYRMYLLLQNRRLTQAFISTIELQMPSIATQNHKNIMNV